MQTTHVNQQVLFRAPCITKPPPPSHALLLVIPHGLRAVSLGESSSITASSQGHPRKPSQSDKSNARHANRADLPPRDISPAVLPMALCRKAPHPPSQAEDGRPDPRLEARRLRLRFHRRVSSAPRVLFSTCAWRCLTIVLCCREKAWKSRSRRWNTLRKTAWKVEPGQKGRGLPIPADIADVPVWVEWDQDVGDWRKGRPREENEYARLLAAYRKANLSSSSVPAAPAGGQQEPSQSAGHRDAVYDLCCLLGVSTNTSAEPKSVTTSGPPMPLPCLHQRHPAPHTCSILKRRILRLLNL